MRLPRDVSADDLAQALAELGYRITRQTGSHLRLNDRRSWRASRDHSTPLALRVGTLAGILGDVAQHFGLTRDELVQRLLG